MAIDALKNAHFYGNSAYAWLIALAIVAIGYPLLLTLRGAVVRHLSKLTQRTNLVADDLIVELLERTSKLVPFALTLGAATAPLTLPPSVGHIVSVSLTTLLIVQCGLWASHAARFMLGRYGRAKADEPEAKGTVAAMSFMVRLGLWVVVALLLLDNFGVEVTALMTTLGVGGIAVALAAQSVLGDLLAAVSIFLDRPVVVGDFVIFDDFLGTIENVGLRSTRIRSLSGEQVIVANSDLLKTRLRNYSRMKERRVVFSIYLAYGAPYDEVAAFSKVIRAAVEAQPKTRFDRAHFKGYGESWLEFETVYYVLDPDYGLYMDTQQAVNLRLFQHVEERGLSFGHPVRVVTLKEPIAPAEPRP